MFHPLGEEVAELVNQFQLVPEGRSPDGKAGSYSVIFQSAVGSKQLASGMYLYQLKVGDYIESKKMLMIK